MVNKNEIQKNSSKPWLVVASEEEFEQRLKEIDRELEERGSRSIAEYWDDMVKSLSDEEKKILNNRLIKINEKYQGPGGP